MRCSPSPLAVRAPDVIAVAAVAQQDKGAARLGEARKQGNCPRALWWAVSNQRVHELPPLFLLLEGCPVHDRPEGGTVPCSLL